MAGCTGNDEPARTETREATETTTTAEDTAQTTTEDTETSTETQTTPQEDVRLEDVHNTRDNLTEGEKREHYRSGIPSVDDYELDYDRVQSENDTRREQLIEITATVGDQYVDWVEGNHAVMNAIHSLDWMGWEQDNILNIVTRYNSRPIEQVTANYSTEDGGRNLDGTIARDSGSGKETYIENIPDSEAMDGDMGNLLVTDVEAWEKSEDEEWDEDSYRGLRLAMQSVVPGIKGLDINDTGLAKERGIVFDSDAIQYIGESYDKSAEAAYEVTEEAMEIHMSSMPVIESGKSVGVTAGEDGLEVDAVYSKEEAEEKLREPVEL